MPEQSRSAQIELLADALRGRSRRRPEPVCTLGQLLAANLEIYAKKPDALLRGFIKRRLDELELALLHDLGGAAK